jgi:hypothetical protein
LQGQSVWGLTSASVRAGRWTGDNLTGIAIYRKFIYFNTEISVFLQEKVAAGTAPFLPLIGLMEEVFNLTLDESLYAIWPNPFLNSSPVMQNQPDLLFVDGSEVLQKIPLWPIIQPARHPASCRFRHCQRC